MFIYLRRIIRFGWYNFWRKGGSNIATVFVLTLTISLVAFLFVAQGGVRHLILLVQDKIDVSAYLKVDSTQEEILTAREKLREMPEVREVIIVSKEEALIEFRERHKDNPVILESLEVIGRNPFHGSFNIRAVRHDQYAAILMLLNSVAMQDVIYRVDYIEKTTIIERISRFIANVNTIGLFLAVVLVLAGILVTFNTVRMAIYDSSKEISIMRLVGASKGFIEGPFIVQGIIAGIMAAFISFLMLFLVAYLLGPRTETLVAGFNIFVWVSANAISLFLLQFASGIALGVISSLIAVRRYLKV